MGLLLLPLLMLQGGPASHSNDETSAIVATVRHVAAELAQSLCKKEACHVSIAGGVPVGDLLHRLAKIPGVLPLPADEADRQLGTTVIDVFSIEFAGPDEAEVGVDVLLDADILLTKCWHRVARRDKGWRVREGPRCAII